MKNFTSSALVALLVAGAAAPALAADAQQTGAGSITVLQPLTITNNDGLEFGTVIRPATGTGHVVVTAASSAARNVDGGVVALASSSFKAAKFTIAGEGGQTLTVTVPTTFDLTNQTTSGTLTVTTSHDLGTLTSVALGGSLGSQSTKAFYVGGSIPITDTTNSGNYTGSFQVTASYN